MTKTTSPPPLLPHSHQAVCCVDPHAALASGSTTPAKRKSTSSHSSPRLSISTIPAPRAAGPCDDCHPCGETVCCTDSACESPSCEGTECCEDPECDQAVADTCEDCHHPLPPPSTANPGGKGTEQEEMEKALGEWMCSKEGCEAIAQYLKVCTEQDCSLPVVHPEATLAIPQLAEPPPPSAHFHITPHTHPHPLPHVHDHAPHTHITHSATSMLPPGFPPAPASVHHTPVTSPIMSWPMSSASSSSTPQALLSQPQTQATLDATFSLPPAGWTDVVQATHICHWQNCHLTFPSMPDLLAHVATDHLGAPGFSAPLLENSHQPVPTMPPAQMLSQPVSPESAGHGNPSTASSIDFTALNFNDFGLSHTATAPSAAQNLPPTHALGMPNGLQGNVDLDKLFGGNDGLLSCLWDDCFPLPDECSADPNEACPPHPVQSHQHHHPPPTTGGTVNTNLLHSHAHDHSHCHDHGHSHAHAHHTAPPGSESFSPQTMLRHVLEEHLGVPSDILGWNELLSAPMPVSTAENVKKAHHKLHSRPRRTVFPTPPSSHPTPSPPLVAQGLTCQWPGCTHIEPFANSAELMDHLSEVHIGRGKDHYVCKWGECQHLDGGDGRLFRSRQKVLRHLQSHTGHKPYVCEECGQAFGEAAPLAAHVRRHAQEKPFVCEYPGCGKRFAISSSLTIHMRTHNGEKPFVCPHCGKGFVEASNLTKHIRTHTGERPFACTHPGCGKRFPRPDQLKRHMGVHDKEKTKTEGDRKRRKSNM